MIETIVVDSLEDLDLSGLTFPIFVLYNHPKDFPNKIAVRVFDFDRPTNIVWLADTIEEARAPLQDRYARISRDEKDHPVIIESYL